MSTDKEDSRVVCLGFYRNSPYAQMERRWRDSHGRDVVQRHQVLRCTIWQGSVPLVTIPVTEHCLHAMDTQMFAKSRNGCQSSGADL